jgi:hypothetical protein
MQTLEYNQSPINFCPNGCDPNLVSERNEDIDYILNTCATDAVRTEIDRVVGDANNYKSGCTAGVCVPAHLAKVGLQQVIIRRGLFIWTGQQTVKD